ncbi:MAG: hypothetical protein EXX96DRAFT_535119 [Benjaminiella poitrasii]|nr:MAG: hypothetical protein EXX96DRAFT_535119 [Benjaminiella poitrasii]
MATPSNDQQNGCICQKGAHASLTLQNLTPNVSSKAAFDNLSLQEKKRFTIGSNEASFYMQVRRNFARLKRGTITKTLLPSNRDVNIAIIDAIYKKIDNRFNLT